MFSVWRSAVRRQVRCHGNRFYLLFSFVLVAKQRVSCVCRCDAAVATVPSIDTDTRVVVRKKKKFWNLINSFFVSFYLDEKNNIFFLIVMWRWRRQCSVVRTARWCWRRWLEIRLIFDTFLNLKNVKFKTIFSVFSVEIEGDQTALLRVGASLCAISEGRAVLYVEIRLILIENIKLNLNFNFNFFL